MRVLFDGAFVVVEGDQAGVANSGELVLEAGSFLVFGEVACV